MSEREQSVTVSSPRLRVFHELRYRIFMVYRRLFSLVWLTNIAILIVVLSISSIDRKWLTTIALINLTIAILIRQDFVINLIYTTCCSIPLSWPLAVRRRMAQVYHLGGIHSGCATAAVLWFAGSFGYSLGVKLSDPRQYHFSSATICLSAIVLFMLLAMAVSAHPMIRKKYHNAFEAIHRLLGWTLLVLVWVQVMLSLEDHKSSQQPLGYAAVRSPDMWLLVVITTSIATSWVFLKRVPVETEVLSQHAIRLHFQYTNAVRGGFLRVSERPLLEWHSFATIPATNNDEKCIKGCSVIVSRAGDWTSRQISKPPTRLWVRGVPTMGVMRVASLFRSVVLIGTGSGIGPLLGHIPSCRLRLIWSTPHPEETFGNGIVESVYEADPDASIWDTRKNGRPNLVELACEEMEKIEAEAVVIISNETVTRLVVGELERKGVPAFGAVWDS
ncbi:unnamed protein product [Penicillium olsonii]|nr:unnamed protein product [Penicillium olsonii]CAG7930494.1 unnamed protein product [Penicillium olsonii]